MIFVYIIPVYVILAAILIAIGGIYHIVTEMYVLLFTITTFLTVIGGIYTFFVSISKAVSTKRVYLLLPGALFLVFGAFATSVFKQSLCLSQRWLESVSLETLGTLTIHKNAVFLWSILAAVVLSLLFAVFFRKSYQTPKTGSSVLFSLLSCLLLIVPVFAVHGYAEHAYYEQNSTSYEQVYTVKETVAVKRYVNESYRGSTLTVQGGDDLIRMLFPQKLEKGETVYGEACQSGDILVFNDDHVIGEVPSEYLEPQ